MIVIGLHERKTFWLLKSSIKPVTLKKTMKMEKELYGHAEDGAGGFDYDSAPDRGWQIGKRDFTDRIPYRKFHEFEPGHPMYNDPLAT